MKAAKGEYKLHHQFLITVPSARYLRVHLNRKLSWNDHVDSRTKKASETLNFVRRNSSTCPGHICEQCYKSLVRRQLKYASSVRDISVKPTIDTIETVQQCAACFTCRGYQPTSSV